MDLNSETINKAVDFLLSLDVSVETIDLSGKGAGSIFYKLSRALIGKTSSEHRYELYKLWHDSQLFRSKFIEKYGSVERTINNKISSVSKNDINSPSLKSLRFSKVFKYTIASVEIDKSLWMEKKNCDLDYWKFIHVKVKEVIEKEHTSICSIKFLGMREKKGRYEGASDLCDYVKCTYEGCQVRYRIDYYIPSSNDSVNVFIRSNYDRDSITHNDLPTENACNELLISEKISDFKEEINTGFPEDDASQHLDGNWQADMEMNFPCYDNDIFVDMAMMFELEKNEKSSIIQCISLPLQIDLYSQERLEIIKYKSDLTMHLSCSANIGKLPENQSGKLLYYSGVVDNIKGSCLPILEFFIMDKHTTALTSCFTNFLRFCSTVVLAWPFTRIVVDCSKVMIWSVLTVWNSINLVDYVNDAYRLITVHNYDITNNFAIYTTVHICTYDFMKTLLEIFKSNRAENAAYKRFYLHIMAAMIDCKCLDHVLKIFESLVIISKSSFKHDMFDKHLASLKCFMINIDNVLFDSIIDTCQDRESFCREFDRNNISVNKWWQVSSNENLFYKLFKETFDNALYELKETEKLPQNRLINNDNYKFDVFCDILVNRYMGILPLWSCIVHRKLRYQDGRLTNDPVKQYHQSIKQYIPHELSDIPLGYLIRKVRHKNDVLVEILKSD